MSTTNPAADIIDELLTPIEQLVSGCADDATRLLDAEAALGRSADVLDDVGEDRCGVLVRKLGRLLRMAHDIAGENQEDSTQRRREIIAFVETGMQSVREALNSESPDASARLPQLTEEIDARWGEHLAILDEERWDANGLDDSPQDPFSEDAGDAAAEAGDVNRILAALQSHSSPTNRPAPVPHNDATPKAGDRAAKRPAPPLTQAAVRLDPELREAYLEDACGCLASMERVILEYENDPEGVAPAERLCRELHTLKGASASVGLSELATQIHKVEEVLDGQSGRTTKSQMDLVMECVDSVRAQIAALETQGEKPPGQEPSSGDNRESIPAPSRATDEYGDASDSLRVRTGQLDRLMDLLAEVVVWRSRREERVVELDGADDELSRCLFRLQAVADAQQRQREERADSGRGKRSVPVNYVSEISNDLREISQNLRRSRNVLAEENRAVSQFILQFRQELVQIRRVPLAGLFQRLHRAVREAARAENKEVRLEVIGEQVGLERSLQEKLYEPLLHLVRNAVSHGIEPAERRVQAGKDPVGTVTLEAYGSPNVLMLEIRDDGGGLDYDAIRRRGLERGMIFADRPVSEAELSRLIFRPGFSTRDQANEISGRGVGMNVVADALNRCQCHLETESNPGAGTVFRLTIPLRSVIEHTLSFRAGGQSFALPMQLVKSTSQSGGDEPAQEATDSAPLTELLRMPASEAPVTLSRVEIADRLTTEVQNGSSRDCSREHRLNLVVDEILGPEEMVVRPLPSLLRRHPHLCGATLSGAGDVVLLLDGRRLLQNFVAGGRTRSLASPEAHEPFSAGRSKRPHVLVVDDSLTARRRMVQALRARGYDTMEAADGGEALDLLRDHTFDAVFSDLEMPHVGGFDLLIELGNMAGEAPPCVMVTTRDEPETQARAAELGAAGFLSKPIDDRAVGDLLANLKLSSHNPVRGA